MLFIRTKSCCGGGGEITQIKYSPTYFTGEWSLSLNVPVKFITFSGSTVGGVLKLVDVERAIQIYASDTSGYRGGRFNNFLKIDDIHSFNVGYGSVTISDDFKTVSGYGYNIMVSIWG